MNASDSLAATLLAAVQAQDFGTTADNADGGRPLRVVPKDRLAPFLAKVSPPPTSNTTPKPASRPAPEFPSGNGGR